MSLNQTSTIFSERESQVRSYCRSFPGVIATAKGSLLWEESGREYIDFLAGAGSLNYGHNDPDMKDALIAYIARDGVAHGLDLHTVAKRDFLIAFRDVILAPRGLDHRVQFTGPTGTNAVEAALKLARRVTGRTNVIAFTNGFHGVSAGALAATASRHHRMGPEQALNGVTRLPYDGYLGADVDTTELLARLLDDPSGGVDEPAAILLEVVQGEGGLNTASPLWLRRVASLAAQHGALLIVDDIQAPAGGAVDGGRRPRGRRRVRFGDRRPGGSPPHVRRAGRARRRARVHHLHLRLDGPPEGGGDRARQHLQLRPGRRRGLRRPGRRPVLPGHDHRLRLLRRGDLGALDGRGHPGAEAARDHPGR